MVFKRLEKGWGGVLQGESGAVQAYVYTESKHRNINTTCKYRHAYTI